MNSREKFLLTFVEREPGVTLKWEFGYWGGAINNWYKQGLPKKNPAQIPKRMYPVSSLYLPAWTCENKYIAPGEYPEGYVLTAGGIAWPLNGHTMDNDVRDYFGLDYSQIMLDTNLLFNPLFDIEVYQDDDEVFKYKDIDGVTRIYLKKQGVVPCAVDYTIKDMKTWLEVKEERMSMDSASIVRRMPLDFFEKLPEYKNRDYALGFGGSPFGFFGLPASLLGYENLFISYYEQPEMIHDMADTFTDIAIAVLAEILKYIEVDYIQLWEDISFGKGSMVSEDCIREFILPYYKKLTSFCRENNINMVCVDTDGDCNKIIPLFIEGGATSMFPFEVNSGMDVTKVREAFPDFVICGGIDKELIGKGKDTIDEILKPMDAMIKKGGYIPFGDHFILPDCPFEDFSYYRNRLNDIIDANYNY